MSQSIAVLQTLIFLGAAGTVSVLCVAATTLLLLRRLRGARIAAVSGVGITALYVVALVVVGVFSRTSVLPRGTAKVFCEIDCHVTFMVVSAAHHGDTVRVILREAFDAASISPRRGNALLTPGTRRFALVDGTGRAYPPVAVTVLSADSLFAPLRPGEVHRAELRFHVPPNTPIAGLLVEDDDPISRLLIAHERSPFHGKTLLDLGISGQARVTSIPVSPAPY